LRFCGERGSFPFFDGGRNGDDQRVDYTNIVKNGILKKKKVGKGWKNRYCILTPSHFVYFENKEAKVRCYLNRCLLCCTYIYDTFFSSSQNLIKDNDKVQGMINLKNSTVKIVTGEKDGRKLFQVVSPKATFIFDAGSDNDNLSWHEKINECLVSIGYIFCRSHITYFFLTTSIREGYTSVGTGMTQRNSSGLSYLVVCYLLHGSVLFLILFSRNI